MAQGFVPNLITDAIYEKNLENKIKQGKISREELEIIRNEKIVPSFAYEGLRGEDLGDAFVNVNPNNKAKTIDTNLTQEEIAAMGYLTPEQMAEQGYMSRADFDAWVAEQAPGLVSDQVQNTLDQQDYETTMGELTTRLDEVDEKYTNAQSQYDADAAKAQIDQTRGDIQNFFASSQHSGPRTGATSQFSKQPSFISGSANPMANLIKSQREGVGQQPYDYYYSSFTPSYSDFDAPISAEEYGQRSGPKTFDYPNPFTQGAASGGSVSNFQQPQQPSLLKHGGGIDQPYNNQGIGAALNFQTNVDPFQSAFRPNVKRR